MVARLLPMVAQVRDMTRRFLGMFDGMYRGWVWFLMIGLLFVLGYRFSGPVAAVSLILAHLLVCLSLWWVVHLSDGRSAAADGRPGPRHDAPVPGYVRRHVSRLGVVPDDRFALCA